MKNILAILAIIGFCVHGIGGIYSGVKFFKAVSNGPVAEVVEYIVLRVTLLSGSLAGVFVAISCLLAAKKAKTTPPPNQPPRIES